MADVRVEWDMDALQRAAGKDDGVEAALSEATSSITAAANALSSGFRTGLYHRDHQSPAVGGTQAAYEGNVEDHGKGNVGIVYTANYAAQKDNLQNNTLLKARG